MQSKLCASLKYLHLLALFKIQLKIVKTSKGRCSFNFGY